ncbi:MAG: hypothetical protein FWG40_01580 [Peptococcaceae bacterium]|nr:hypothetical protein [Peptococcaceae bacterium]
MIVVFKNNLISIVIHLFLCALLLLPMNYLWWGGVWYDRSYEIWVTAINGFLVVIYSSIAISLYYFLGKKFLISSRSIVANTLSVTVLFVILSIVILFAYDTPAERVIRIPFYPVGHTISYFLKVNEKLSYLITSLLPSLTMGISMITKRSS